VSSPSHHTYYSLKKQPQEIKWAIGQRLIRIDTCQCIFTLTMCLCSWKNSNDFPNSRSTRRELLCHPERMCKSSTPSQSVTCKPTASGTIAFQLQFIYKTTQESLCCSSVWQSFMFLLRIWILSKDC